MRRIPDVREQAGTPALWGLGQRPRSDLGRVAVRCILSLLSLLLAPRLFAADAADPADHRNDPPESPGVVEVSFAASPGTLYRLCESRDLATWKVRQTRVAAEEVLRFAIPTDEPVSAFFRVEVIPIRPLESHGVDRTGRVHHGQSSGRGGTLFG